MELLRRIVDVLDAKSEAIASKRQASDRPLAEQAQHEVMSFWLSHAIHSSLPPLRHHLTARRTQPAELYAELARLAGALCTFSLDAHPRTLPRYSHEELGGLFAALDRHIRTHLELVAPTHCVTVPLRPVRAYFHTGSISDKRCLGPSQWIIGVRSPVKDADVASGVPRLVKICSADHLARVVKEARAALPLEHLPHPPVAVSPRSDTQYFNVQKEGPCWKAIAKSNNVGAYVPSAIEDPELELLIVLESGDA
jgi:type VI secretion system protein ImpJ